MRAKGRTGPRGGDRSPAEQIDAIIEESGGWHGEVLSHLRALIREADPGVVEEVKWKKPSNPLGVPVWSHGGIVCVGNVLKRSVRLTFPQGARVKDPKGLFNARLDSKTVRAIDVHEGEAVDEASLRALTLAAVGLNVNS
ncbi:MAG: DUF1801 domain-containing protein [Nitrososphaerota archaeon]|nr:DUF1801 domain-containing protein [Nitrososphaerota archaeon]MDG6966930.1 DUF1801 domain-containing protein [Nitrososphaerota archaeon]MDG6978734.1 DUF1801 domain-containing protein [Nitrososphaerota archaeon]MDG7006429.1 DUF1801 domain-containing protein [Nitrososphaerota archaeon]